MTAFEHIVMDYDSSLNDELLSICLDLSELIIIVVNQNNYLLEKGIEAYKKIKGMLDKPEEKHITFLVNEYSPVVSSYKSVASKLGIKPKELLALSYSPYIIKCSNSKAVEECFVSAHNNDIRVGNIKQDMLRVGKYIAGLGKR